MASSRLTESQKEELVARYSQGEASLALAEAFGVSANTVSRVVRAALPPDLYESLKQQRSRGGTVSLPSSVATSEPVVTSESAVITAPVPQVAGDGEAGTTVSSPGSFTRRRRSSAVLPPSEAPEAIEQLSLEAPASELPASEVPLSGAPRQASVVSQGDAETGDNEHVVLAIDDADDFGEDQGEEFGDDDGEGGGDDFEPFRPIAVSLMPVDGAPAVTCLPLTAASFNGGVYMLVDKTVELQPRPLREFSELGLLPDDEADRQAIAVFINPREAKRQCGRSQRVIKMPDPRLLERTAPYLLAQGISRVVMEGALYALPGS